MADTDGTPKQSWFDPLWVRVVVVVLVACWSAWEWLVNHDQFWGSVTLAATAYGAWDLIVRYKPKPPQPPTLPPPSPPGA